MRPLLSPHRKYTVICSHEQRQGYKQDFNKEYDEYRDLHARIDGVTRQFLDLDSQLKQLHQESRKYKVNMRNTLMCSCIKNKTTYFLSTVGSSVFNHGLSSLFSIKSLTRPPFKVSCK